MSSPISKTQVIEIVMTFLSHSAMRESAALPGFRALLEVEISEILHDSTLDLDPLWSILEAQRGFSKAAGASPLLALREMQGRLGLKVILPPEIEQIPPAKRRELVKMCEVPPRQLERLLLSISARPTTSRTSTSHPKSENRIRAFLSSNPIFTYAIFGLGLLGMLYAGFSTYQGCSPNPDWRSLNSDFAAPIPIAKAKRLGDEAGAVLINAKWLAEPLDTRKEQLQTALENLYPKRIRSLFLTDLTGTIVATAQYYGAQDEHMLIRFPNAPLSDESRTSK